MNLGNLGNFFVFRISSLLFYLRRQSHWLRGVRYDGTGVAKPKPKAKKKSCGFKGCVRTEDDRCRLRRYQL